VTRLVIPGGGLGPEAATAKYDVICAAGLTAGWFGIVVAVGLEWLVFGTTGNQHGACQLVHPTECLDFSQILTKTRCRLSSTACRCRLETTQARQRGSLPAVPSDTLSGDVLATHNCQYWSTQPSSRTFALDSPKAVPSLAVGNIGSGQPKNAILYDAINDFLDFVSTSRDSIVHRNCPGGGLHSNPH
jgi:hypothetical protein